MIDVNSFSEDILREMNVAYLMAAHEFKCMPENEKPSKQQYMFKWLKRKISIRKDIIESVENAEDFFNMLAECNNKLNELEKSGTAKVKGYEDFDDEVKAFNDMLYEYEKYKPIKVRNGKAYFSFDDIGVDSTVILDLVPNEDEDKQNYDICGEPFYDFELKKVNGTYHLSMKASCWNEKSDYWEEKNIVLEFIGVQVQNRVYNVTEDNNVINAESPWRLLWSMADVICSKADKLVPLNEKEKELLPLLREFSSISNFSLKKGASFPLFKDLLIQHGHNKLLPLVENLENKCGVSIKLTNQLFSKLNEVKYIDLWRDIYGKIQASQAEYPWRKIENIDGIDYIRKTIQKRMEGHGYSGEYPDFYKEGSINGLHIEYSYGLTYFVCREKNVMFRVHFVEYEVDNHLALEINIGTAMLKNGETVNNIYECSFNAKGKRLFHQTTQYEFRYEPIYRTVTDVATRSSIETIVDAAVKRAELKRFTKEERKAYSEIGNGILLNIGVALFSGLFFAVFMAFGFMLIAFLCCLFTGQIQEFPELLTAGFLYKITFAGGGAFAVLTFIFELIASR